MDSDENADDNEDTDSNEDLSLAARLIQLRKQQDELDKRRRSANDDEERRRSMQKKKQRGNDSQKRTVNKRVTGTTRNRKGDGNPKAKRAKGEQLNRKRGHGSPHSGQGPGGRC